MVRGCSPGPAQQFYAAEFIHCNAPPVRRRSRRLQTALAFSAILIAQRSKLPPLIPSQSVRTQQTMPIVINSRDRPPGLHGFAHRLVNILQPPRLS